MSGPLVSPPSSVFWLCVSSMIRHTSPHTLQTHHGLREGCPQCGCGRVASAGPESHRALHWIRCCNCKEVLVVSRGPQCEFPPSFGLVAHLLCFPAASVMFLRLLPQLRHFSHMLMFECHGTVEANAPKALISNLKFSSPSLPHLFPLRCYVLIGCTLFFSSEQRILARSRSASKSGLARCVVVSVCVVCSCLGLCRFLFVCLPVCSVLVCVLGSMSVRIRCAVPRSFVVGMRVSPP